MRRSNDQQYDFYASDVGRQLTYTQYVTPSLRPTREPYEGSIGSRIAGTPPLSLHIPSSLRRAFTQLNLSRGRSFGVIGNGQPHHKS